MGDTYLVRKLEKLEAGLARLALPADSPVLVDRIGQLRVVLERLRHTTAGEVRIVALGANSSLKSTTLRLLLGRDDILSVGPGAVSAVSTELRLVQDEGPTGPPEYKVVTLTEEGARRRARRLLDVEEDDRRTLEELSRTPHPNVGLVQEMLAAVEQLGYGETLTLEQLSAREGSLTFSSGRGSPLIARVTARVRVPAEAWPLAWAAGRSVVIVDTPGTRKGGALEDVVIAETQSRAHIALLTVACGGGTQFTTPRAAPDPHCVFVATRLDAVDNPGNANSLRVLETNIASMVRDIGAHGRPGRETRVAAVCGPWAAADEAAWIAFDPDNPHIWKGTQPAREQWRAAAWDPSGATGGQLRTAVEGALADGGVGRLRELIAELADKDAAHVDSLEFEQLIEDGIRLLKEAGGHVPAAGKIKRQEAAARDDARPIADLRRIAREQADTAVYAADAWSKVRLPVEQSRSGGRVEAEALQPLRDLDVAGLAAGAIDGTRAELTDALASWWASHTRADFATEAPQARLIAPHGPDVDEAERRLRADADAKAAAQVDSMARRLLQHLAGRHTTDDAGSRPAARLYFRQVARVREELARLLERMLIDTFEPAVVLTQKALGELLVQQRLALVSSTGPVAVLNQIGAELQQLSTARAGSA
ncbi:hypothetical protein [Streptomyces flavofungini]|uniref:Dynamin family protein n=1 Tax=Streptomyces flavofungini TaxID=68200 RepID=A0ABS0XF84_9ACTN|nr:hypothetical protein [Streptomyces flavofungini]MBJ3811886.1 hypothetical protein [Streptomyces flavofungini]GHC52696.1 hypothetical protein GCM10010349_18470 [Streptomyces flavofungini]